MAWEIAVVLDDDCSVRNLGAIVHRMPVWAMETAERRTAAAAIQEQAGEIWTPEPAFTLFRYARSDAAADCLSVMSTMDEHHPHLGALELIGTGELSERWAEILKGDNFVPCERSEYGGLRLRRPLNALSEVRELVLDAADWTTADDFYSTFFKMVGAPDWHGRNFNALRDSIAGGGINGVEVPYRIIFLNAAEVPVHLKVDIYRFAEAVCSFAAKGCPVTVEFRAGAR